ncbi:MAG: hypothetical protein OER87_19305 [Gammaproteobacteria bacterium]|nr:hypothetical protein [Gammaproteobacteria bacterium]MDH3537899.1 hypothetical protein [Gammaproteobacteria bacterium]
MTTAFGAVADASPVEQLKWLQTTSVEQAFKRDRGAGKQRFYVIFGYSQEIVGIGNLNYSRCYRGVELVVMRGTSDTPESEEHSRLIDLAYAFADEYNRLMQQHIDSQGGRTCPAEANWDGMLAVLTNFVWGSSQLEGMVGIVRSEVPTITIDLKDVTRLDKVSRFTCETLQAHGIKEAVLIKVYEWLPPPGYNSRGIDEFSCVQGRINR